MNCSLTLLQAKSDLESYIHTAESQISNPEMGAKLKRGARAAIEAEIAKSLEAIETEDIVSTHFLFYIWTNMIPMCSSLTICRPPTS